VLIRISEDKVNTFLVIWGNEYAVGVNVAKYLYHKIIKPELKRYVDAGDKIYNVLFELLEQAFSSSS